MTKTKPAPLAAFYRVAGADTAARLLHQIVYWQSRAKVRHGEGAPWIAKDRALWMYEVSLSRNQTDRAFSRLRARDLIETGQWFYGKRSILHVRLTAVAIALLGSQKRETHGVLESEKPAVLKSEKPKSTRNYLKETKQQEGVLAHAPGPEPGGQEGTGSMKIPPGKTVSEVIAHAHAKPMPENTSLQYRWQQIVATVYGGFVPTMTLKQRGQLRLVAKACPAGKAAAVLDAVLHDWGDFAGQVKQQAGLTTAPSKPDVGFLLKHVGIAVNFAFPPPLVVPVAPKPVVRLKLKKPVVPKPPAEQYPQTLEEVLSMPPGVKS
jgi:hypothetical protein